MAQTPTTERPAIPPIRAHAPRTPGQAFYDAYRLVPPHTVGLDSLNSTPWDKLDPGIAHPVWEARAQHFMRLMRVRLMRARTGGVMTMVPKL